MSATATRTLPNLLAFGLVLISNGCITTDMWKAALDPRGEAIRREQHVIGEVWTAGSDKLGVTTVGPGGGERVILERDDESMHHPSIMLRLGGPIRCSLSLDLLEGRVGGGMGELELSGTISIPLRELPVAPGPLTDGQDSWSDLASEFFFLFSEHDSYPQEVTVGGWLLDGVPTAEDQIIRRALRTQQPNFAILRRAEMWVETDYGTHKSWHAARGDALWMSRNVECLMEPAALQWTHRTTWTVLTDAPEPVADHGLPVPPIHQVDIVWYEERDRFWGVFGATLATPITFTIDVVLSGTIIVVLVG